MNKQAAWDERYANKALVWSKEPNRKFAQIAATLPVGCAFDAACGEGRNAIWLASRGWQVTAADFSSVGLQKAQELAGQADTAISWLHEDLTTYRPMEYHFDLVTILYFHTDSDARNTWLPALIKAVRPGGSLIYIGHDPENITQGIGGPQDPDVLPDAEAITQHLADFDIHNAEQSLRDVTSEPGHGAPLQGTAIDTLVFATRNEKI